MKLFADHCFFSCGVELLHRAGYDIIKAIDAGLQEASDKEIVSFCRKEDRIILTLDNDFTCLYKFPLGTHKGIVFFRINPFAPEALLNILEPLVKRKMFAFFENALVIVKKNKIHITRPTRTIETT